MQPSGLLVHAIEYKREPASGELRTGGKRRYFTQVLSATPLLILICKVYRRRLKIEDFLTFFFVFCFLFFFQLFRLTLFPPSILSVCVGFK